MANISHDKADRRQFHTLDGLRGAAALAIVVLHTPHFFNQWRLPFSFLAVDLFFILSGFVLSAAYEEKFKAGMSAGTFARLRLIRLYPLYLLGTLCGVPVALLSMKFGGIGIEWSPGLFATSLPFSLAMLPTPSVGKDAFLLPFNAVLWSIIFEVAINIVYALLARTLADTRKLVALVGLSAVALIAYGMAAETLDVGATWYTLAGGAVRTLFGFFCGVLVYRLGRPDVIRNSALALGLVAALAVLMAVPHSTASVLATVIFLFPALIFVASWIEPGPALQRTFGVLGVTSYAVYALHKPIYQLLLGFLIVVSPVKPEHLAPALGVAYLICLVGGCIVVDRIYDMPARRWLSGRWRKKDERAAFS